MKLTTSMRTGTTAHAGALACTRFLIAVILTLSLPGCTALQRAELWSAWRGDNALQKPFRIASEFYYVGSSDIAVFAINTSDGIILIDGGYLATSKQVEHNLLAVGLDIRNVRKILVTHAHMDHAAGVARLKLLSKAELISSYTTSLQLAAGGRNDYALRSIFTYPVAVVDRIVNDGDTVELGNTTVTAHLTPGHSPGCTSWSFKLVVDKQLKDAVVLCSLTVLPTTLHWNNGYPRIADDFEETFSKLSFLPCQLWVTGHASEFEMTKKLELLEPRTSPNPFAQPDDCQRYIRLSREKFEHALGTSR